MELNQARGVLCEGISSRIQQGEAFYGVWEWSSFENGTMKNQICRKMHIFSAENFSPNLFLFPLSFNKKRLVCKCEANFMQYTWFISDTNGHLTKLEAFPMWNELLSIISSLPSEKCTQASGMSSPTNVDDFLEIFKQPLTHPCFWHNMLKIFRKMSTFAFLPWSYIVQV